MSYELYAEHFSSSKRLFCYTKPRTIVCSIAQCVSTGCTHLGAMRAYMLLLLVSLAKPPNAAGMPVVQWGVRQQCVRTAKSKHASSQWDSSRCQHASSMRVVEMTQCACLRYCAVGGSCKRHAVTASCAKLSSKHSNARHRLAEMA
eukprot:7231-Heterococcus_DN1.PRE.2